MNPLSILALIIMAAGFAVVFSARLIVNKYALAEKQSCKYADELSEQEVEEYKINKAIYNIKLMGLIISVPGLVLFVLSK